MKTAALLVCLNVLLWNVIFCTSKPGQVISCVDPVSKTLGECISLSNCEYALSLIENGTSPYFCRAGSEINFNALVCCVDRRRLRKSVSLEMCKKYHDKPEDEDTFSIFVTGGRKSLAKEFPHMAILGYEDNENINLLCGGTLISDKFVLTAAHCVENLAGPPTSVRLGDLDIKNGTDDADPQDFKIVRTVVHPQYQPPSVYHDIALVELDRSPKFTDYVSPACLYPLDRVEELKLTATGWGHTFFLGEPSSHLLAVNLPTVDSDRCNRIYKSTSRSRLSNGIMDNIQICAGGGDGKDTCQGDSGGPLQRKNQNFPKKKYVYDIIGITSFGRACGLADNPGVYTKVSAYLDWIEKIVWPSTG